jgi:hypothetical protein
MLARGIQARMAVGGGWCSEPTLGAASGREVTDHASGEGDRAVIYNDLATGPHSPAYSSTQHLSTAQYSPSRHALVQAGATTNNPRVAPFLPSK